MTRLSKQEVKKPVYTEHYAILPKNDTIAKPPVFVIVDRTLKSKLEIHSIEKNKDNLSQTDRFHRNVINVVKVSSLNVLSLSVCQDILDTQCSKIVIVQLPLVSPKGGLHSLSTIVKDFRA